MKYLLSAPICILVLACSGGILKQKLADSSVNPQDIAEAQPVNITTHGIPGIDSIEDLKNQLTEGRIIDFSISGKEFRLKYYHDVDSVVIEYKVGAGWKKNASLEMRDQFGLMDNNYDGHPDFYSQYGGENFVNYYIPAKNIFSEQFELPGDGEIVIDSSQKLYANYSEPYHECNYYASQLLDYKNDTPRVHYFLSGITYVVDGECHPDSIERIELYKHDEAKDTSYLLKAFRPQTPKSFPYEEFWKKNYKRLMGY